MIVKTIELIESFSEADLEFLEFLPEELEQIESELYPDLENISFEDVAEEMKAYLEAGKGKGKITAVVKPKPNPKTEPNPNKLKTKRVGDMVGTPPYQKGIFEDALVAIKSLKYDHLPGPAKSEVIKYNNKIRIDRQVPTPTAQNIQVQIGNNSIAAALVPHSYLELVKKSRNKGQSDARQVEILKQVKWALHQSLVSWNPIYKNKNPRSRKPGIWTITGNFST
ncbi:MAG: hypothetical protein HC917_05470 [Richelia sp. SM2_1_7]|nr:hypothetical protein [Richelia sp. SM2_1_7]